MAKIALLADLHGNMPATRAMEMELEKHRPDEIWFLGDMIGKGPENDKTCDWVREHCTKCLGGNWDFGICNEEYGQDAFYREQLGKERLDWIRSLPTELELVISGTRFRLFHGRPVTRLFQGEEPDSALREFFTREEEHYTGIISADSHRPFVRLLQEGYAINTGSVGNGLGKPVAHALLLEGVLGSEKADTLQITILSVPYDNEEAARIARETTELPRGETFVREVLTGIYSR